MNYFLVICVVDEHEKNSMIEKSKRVCEMLTAKATREILSYRHKGLLHLFPRKVWRDILMMMRTKSKRKHIMIHTCTFARLISSSSAYVFHQHMRSAFKSVREALNVIQFLSFANFKRENSLLNPFC